MDNNIEKTGLIETVVGIIMDAAPVICVLIIIAWAGRAYTEGYGLFVQKSLDSPGDVQAHSEMVTIFRGGCRLPAQGRQNSAGYGSHQQPLFFCGQGKTYGIQSFYSARRIYPFFGYDHGTDPGEAVCRPGNCSRKSDYRRNTGGHRAVRRTGREQRCMGAVTEQGGRRG